MDIYSTFSTKSWFADCCQVKEVRRWGEGDPPVTQHRDKPLHISILRQRLKQIGLRWKIETFSGNFRFNFISRKLSFFY